MISRSSSWLLGMMTVLLISLGFVLSAASPSCARRADMALNSMYSEDHLNYLCMNYSRPTPLPCRPVIEKWKPRWWDGEKRKRKFVIYAWWPPAPEELEAYAEAGFNMALTGNMIAAYCEAKDGGKSPVSMDELFEANIKYSDELARLGIMTVFDTDHGCNAQIYASGGPYAYGNATGGIVELRSNITALAPNSPYMKAPWPGTSRGRPKSHGQTIPELEYITDELARRGKLEHFAGIFVHDDTLLQTGETVSSTAWLMEHSPSFLPFVNQVAPGPQTLARTGLPTYSPEQYYISCPDSNCSDPKFNATSAAIGQMGGYATNAWMDARFGLHSWPLFNMGAGNGPINSSSVSPDRGYHNTRSDSLVRFMAYAAVAYGAKALNYYCWGGGVWWIDHNRTKPGKPSPVYKTVVEINADVGAWGDELVTSDFHFSGALHTGFSLEGDGGGAPSASAVVVSMSHDLLVGVFVPPTSTRDDRRTDATDAYLVVVDKRVSGQLAPVEARNATLLLHPSVGFASVAKPGRQGPRGFDELQARHGVAAPRRGARRRHYAHVRDAGNGAAASQIVVTVELVGGGGGFVRLQARAGMQAALLDACFDFVGWTYRPAEASLSVRSPTLNVGLKQGSWAYDTFPYSYRPYEGLELTAGKRFEDGEQTAFIIGASMRGVPPPSVPDESKAYAWAGFNLLSLEAPSPADLSDFGNASASVGAVLDAGYPFGYFVVLEPSISSDSRQPELSSSPASSHEQSPAAASSLLDSFSPIPLSSDLAPKPSSFAPSRVVALTQAFRCHARFGGLVLATNMTDATHANGALAASAALRTYAQGNWLLPFASSPNPAIALSAGERGLIFPMPMVPVFVAATMSAAQWAQQVAAQYEPLRARLAVSYRPDAHGLWRSDATFAFVASVDACASPSDSMLRWSAFSALAYGARGLFWQGAGKCAPYGSPRFGLLASINKRIAQWGNTFVSDWRNSDFAGGGYNVTHLWSSGFQVPHAVPPGSRGPADLVQAADSDVLVAALGSMGRQPATTLIYVVDMRVHTAPGGAPPRQLSVQLRSDVLATQPIEGDCAASRCQCGMSLLGSRLTIKLPGGSGQLVALSLESDT